MIYSGSIGRLIDGDKGLDVVVVILKLDIQNGKREETVQLHQSDSHFNPPADAVEERNGKYRLSNGNYCRKNYVFLMY